MALFYSFAFVLFACTKVLSFQPCVLAPSRGGYRSGTIQCATSSDGPSTQPSKKQKDNKAMAFLRKIGKVGGAANKDFRFAIGIDEGTAGKTPASGGTNVGTFS